MEFTLHPWQLYFLILAGWVNRQQQTVIDDLRTENQVLGENPTWGYDRIQGALANVGYHITDTDDGFLNGKRYVLMDRDGKFCQPFRDTLRDQGAKPLLLPPLSRSITNC